MAKLKSGMINLSGKFDDVVYVHGGKNNRYVRKAVAKGTKANEPALKEQYTRTKYLNALASEINTIVAANVGRFKPPDFYHNMQARFRKEPLNNRFLLLMQLKGMEVDPKNPLNRLGVQDVGVRVLKNKFVVTINVKQHPEKGRQKANCYCYDVLLITWDKGNKPAKYTTQFSCWVDMNDGYPDIDFPFVRTAGVVHWMLCLRQRLGINKEVIMAQRNEGMRLVEVESLDPKDHALLKKREEGRKKDADKGESKKEEEVVRVMPKSIRRLS